MILDYEYPVVYFNGDDYEDLNNLRQNEPPVRRK